MPRLQLRLKGKRVIISVRVVMKCPSHTLGMKNLFTVVRARAHLAFSISNPRIRCEITASNKDNLVLVLANWASLATVTGYSTLGSEMPNFFQQPTLEGSLGEEEKVKTVLELILIQ